MADEATVAPDGTAVRVALWRAMHVQADPPPHVLEDEIGLRLADPDDGWRDRGDMHPDGTRTFRASIVVRSRFVEDLVRDEAARGSVSTCCWVRAWTPSCSGGRTWPPG
jgi:O-methyltransferase involved in polyketide biosynthesis